MDEDNLIKLRREGIGAILMNSEYIPYKNRFDKIICEDIFYQIYSPSIAWNKHCVWSQKVGGEAWGKMGWDGWNLLIKGIHLSKFFKRRIGYLLIEL